MSLIHTIFTPLFDGMLYPFRDQHPLLGLTLMSLLTAITVLLVFKYTSNQQALARAKHLIQGHLFEIRLFNQDTGAILRAQAKILRYMLVYLRLSLVPMAWLLVPLMLLIAQLQSYYGYQSPLPGETFIVEAQLTKATLSTLDGRRPAVSIHSSGDGLLVQTPAVWVPAQGRLVWRVGLGSPGQYELTLSLNGINAAKSFDARPQTVRRSVCRVRNGLLDQLRCSAEPTLPENGPFQSVSIGIRETAMSIPGLGWDVHWTIAYLSFSLVLSLLLKRRFHTTI